MLAERGIEVDHVTLYRWVQRFTPLLVEAGRPCRHAVGDRWFVDETYVKVAGQWRYVYRAVDQYGQVIDGFVSTKRDTTAAERFFTAAIDAHGEPAEVTTDRSPALARALEERRARTPGLTLVEGQQGTRGRPGSHQRNSAGTPSHGS